MLLGAELELVVAALAIDDGSARGGRNEDAFAINIDYADLRRNKSGSDDLILVPGGEEILERANAKLFTKVDTVNVISMVVDAHKGTTNGLVEHELVNFVINGPIRISILLENNFRSVSNAINVEIIANREIVTIGKINIRKSYNGATQGRRFEVIGIRGVGRVGGAG